MHCCNFAGSRTLLGTNTPHGKVYFRLSPGALCLFDYDCRCVENDVQEFFWHLRESKKRFKHYDTNCSRWFDLRSLMKSVPFSFKNWSQQASFSAFLPRYLSYSPRLSDDALSYLSFIALFATHMFTHSSHDGIKYRKHVLGPLLHAENDSATD